MKKIITIIVLIVIGVIVFNYFSGGNRSAVSPEEQELESLRNELGRVRRMLREANSAGALGGADITDEIDEAYREIARIESELNRLKQRLTTESAKQKAEQLQKNLDDFKQSL